MAHADSVRRHLRGGLGRLAAALALFCAAGGESRAGYVVHSFGKSAYNANAAILDAAVGTTGYAVEDFEDTALLAGLSVRLSFRNGSSDVVLTSLARTASEADNTGLFDNVWDGSRFLLNTAGNVVGTDPERAALTAFEFAGGVASVGVGLSNFQSLSSPAGQFPTTDHRLYVNGVAAALTLEDIVGPNWTPGRTTRNAYLRIDADAGDRIYSIGFGNIAPSANGQQEDLLVFDHLALLPAAAQTAPEPGTLALMGLGSVGMAFGVWRKRRRAAALPV